MLLAGVEALAKVPKEFVVQRNTNANPPTFFLTLQYILQKYATDLTNERLMVLERLYPRLQVRATIKITDCFSEGFRPGTNGLTARKRDYFRGHLDGGVVTL